jgi:hypothetical protein
MATARRKWVCPSCSTSYDIPAGAVDPVSCPRCQDQATFPVVPPQVLRRPSSFGRSRSAAGIVLVACGVLAVSGLWWLATSVDESGGLRDIAQDALRVIVRQERTAVDAYLKENLSSPDYSVVRWWEPQEWGAVHRKAEVARAMDTLRNSETSLAEHLKEFAAADAENRKYLIRDLNYWKDRVAADKQRVEDAKRIPDQIAVRMKFRTKNIFGALSLQDVVFVIQDGRVVDTLMADDERQDYWDSPDARELFTTEKLNPLKEPMPKLVEDDAFDAVKRVIHDKEFREGGKVLPLD